MTEQTEKLRAEFEEKIQQIIPALNLIWDDKSGQYYPFDTQIAWLSWQAAKQSMPVSEWKTIESAPHDGRLALAYRPLANLSQDDIVSVKRFIGGNNHCWDCTVTDGQEKTNPTDGSCHVTHWMPLPEPPKCK